MFRFAGSLLVGLFLFGSASAQNSDSQIVTDPKTKTVNERLRETYAKRQAEIKAAVEAARIPAVHLSEAQMAKVRAKTSSEQLAWYGAGRQSDGKIFVCLVTNGKTLFGESRAEVFAGTFESDGSFGNTLAFLQGWCAVVRDCRKRGFDPPVVSKYGICW